MPWRQAGIRRLVLVVLVKHECNSGEPELLTLVCKAPFWCLTDTIAQACSSSKRWLSDASAEQPCPNIGVPLIKHKRHVRNSKELYGSCMRCTKNDCFFHRTGIIVEQKLWILCTSEVTFSFNFIRWTFCVPLVQCFPENCEKIAGGFSSYW